MSFGQSSKERYLGALIFAQLPSPQFNIGCSASITDCGGAIADATAVGWVFRPISINSNTIVTATLSATATELMRDVSIPIALLGTKGFVLLETLINKLGANSHTMRIGNENAGLTSFATTQPNQPVSVKIGKTTDGKLRILTPYTPNGSSAAGSAIALTPSQQNLSLYLTDEGTAGDAVTMYGYSLVVQPAM